MSRLAPLVLFQNGLREGFDASLDPCDALCVELFIDSDQFATEQHCFVRAFAAAAG